MRILVVGGGSGGHITPAVAVAREILQMRPRARVEFWTDRKYYQNVVKITTEIGMGWGEESKLSGRRPYIRVRKIWSGKFRRYAGWKPADYFKRWNITLKDLIWKNFWGFWGFCGGIMQSMARLIRRSSRPDVIFLKGGFVGLPVGMVARCLKIPYIVHESDAVPGLANRLLMKRATVVAWGMRLEENEKPADNAVFVGVPVAAEFRKVSKTRQAELKKVLGFSSERALVVITGGSQGSEDLNEAIRAILPEILKFASVGLVAGRANYESMVDLKKYEAWERAKLQSNFRLWAFSSAMQEVLGAADVVVSRAGATTIAELAALKKAVILVPFERLPGVHQVKNATRLEKLGAAWVIDNAKMSQKPEKLLEKIQKLARSPKVREELAEKLHEQYEPESARRLAEILLEVAGKGKILNEDLVEFSGRDRKE